MTHYFIYLCFTIAVLSTWINSSTSTICSIDKQEEYGNQRQTYRTFQHYVVSTSATYTCENVKLPFSKPSDWNNNWKKTLVIKNSNLTEISSAEFLPISDVLSLRLSDDHIKSILPGGFTGLSTLNKLYLDHNELIELPQGLFNSLLGLSTLDISSNKIEHIHPHFLIGILNLNYLDLSHNSLYQFNHTFLGQNSQFTEINLSDNHISELVLNASGITVNKLDASKNNLTALNLCVTGLIELNVSFNHLRFLLADDCLNSLKKLDISYNLLTETNINNISRLILLTYLNLAGNNITFVSTGLFANLKMLTYLDMSHNKLKTLSYGMFDNMKQLEYLDISNNNLTSLKRYLHSLSTLKTLNINNNNLKSIDGKQILFDMPDLKSIDLHQNNFACNKLIEVIQDLKDRVKRGNGKVGSNIHGISCDEYEFDVNDDEAKFKEFINYLENAISSKLEKSVGHEFERSFMYNYFNTDFKDSSFYKYLENLRNVNLLNLNETQLLKYFNDDFSNSQFYKFLEGLRASENSTLEFNRSIYNYFNRDFSNSSFVKYLNQLEKSKDFFVNDFEKTGMFNFFNKGFKDTMFYRYTENFKSQFGTQQQSPESEYFHKTSENTTNYFIILSVIVILLTMSVSIQVINLYRNFNKRAIIGKEQVELISSNGSI